MNKSLKKTLLASAAGAALAVGVSIGSAKAFDDVDWSFDLHIDPCVDIAFDLDPASMTTLEAEQTSIGEITALSVVKDIEVKQPRTHHEGDDEDEDHMSHALDALTQLGKLVSAATAVANNVNVTTNTDAMFVNLEQTASGGVGEPLYESAIGEVNAKSIVKDIDNLQVDSSATAVANNINLSQVVSALANTTAVVNVEQTSYMDVEAKSIVKDIDLKNYKNLGSLTSPVISSVATAVGNNLNVSVTKAK